MTMMITHTLRQSKTAEGVYGAQRQRDIYEPSNIEERSLD